MPEAIRTGVTVSACFNTPCLNQPLQNPSCGRTETRLKTQDVTKLVRRAPLGELTDYIQSAQQIDRQVDAVAFHEFDASIQTLAEERRRVVFEAIRQARIARSRIKSWRLR